MADAFWSSVIGRFGRESTQSGTGGGRGGGGQGESGFGRIGARGTTAGAEDDELGFARCCSLELGSSCTEEEKGGLGRHGKLRGVRGRRRAVSGRDCRRVDALAGDHSGGMGVGAQYRAQEGHCLLV